MERGLSSVPLIQAHLDNFVERQIKPLPSSNDPAYYPFKRVVRNHKDIALRAMKKRGLQSTDIMVGIKQFLSNSNKAEIQLSEKNSFVIRNNN